MYSIVPARFVKGQNEGLSSLECANEQSNLGLWYPYILSVYNITTQWCIFLTTTQLQTRFGSTLHSDNYSHLIMMFLQMWKLKNIYVMKKKKKKKKSCFYFVTTCSYLTLSTPGTTFSRRHFKIFYLFFFQKTGLDIPWNVKVYFLGEKYDQCVICSISPECGKGQLRNGNIYENCLC